MRGILNVCVCEGEKLERERERGRGFLKLFGQRLKQEKKLKMGS
jgi:hypothetical protein